MTGAGVRRPGTLPRRGSRAGCGCRSRFPFAPPSVFSNGSLGTNFTSANIAFNTYAVSSDYLLRNDLLNAPRGVTLTLGVYNIFNTDSQIYDYVGAGSYWAENALVTQAANAFQENNVKLRGLTPRSVDFSITTRI